MFSSWDDGYFNWKAVIMYGAVFREVFVWYVNWRQYQKVQTRFPPPKFKPFLSLDSFEKSKLYSGSCCIKNIVKSIHSLVKTVLIVGFDLIHVLWILSDAVSPKEADTLAKSVYFMVVSTTYEFLFNLPYDYYETFVIEHAFGFNNYTNKTWLIDQLKVLVIKLLIIPPFYYHLTWILNRYLKSMVIAGTGLFFVNWSFFVLMFPLVILPLFFEVQELPNNELKNRLNEEASKLNFPISQIKTINFSKKSAHAKAMFFGLPFCTKHIILYDTLIHELSHEELVSIVVHKICHWKQNHNLYVCIIDQLSTVYLLFGFSYFIQNSSFYSQFGFTSERPVLVGLLLYFEIFNILFVPVKIVLLKILRMFELQADQFTKNFGLGKELKQALIKLEKKQLNLIDIDWLYSLYFNSEPILSERLSAL